MTGNTKSCGCLAAEYTASLTKHGDKRGKDRARLYVIWTDMLDRCRNPNSPAWRNYGGRGISVCDEWKADYAAFRSWALRSGYGDGLSIDRIDNGKGYEPANCRWVPRSEQSRNRRTNILITIGGVTKLKTDWARGCGLADSGGIEQRLKRGWPLEKACTFPAKPRERSVAAGGESMSISGWARRFSFSVPGLYQFADARGMAVDEAVRWLYEHGRPERREPMVIEARGERHTVREWSGLTGIPPEAIRDRLRRGWSAEEAVSLRLGMRRR